MKESRIKIYGWSDLKKWFWDTLCFPRRMLVVQWLHYYNEQMRSYTEELLLKYNNKDLEKDDYAILGKAMKDWDKESRKICDKTVKLIMMKE